MKRFEYSEGYLAGHADKLHELEQGKHDDYDLPEFSKEVPSSSSRREQGETVSVRYSWRGNESPSLKVKSIEFRKGEELEDFFKTNARDGADTVCMKRGGSIYVLRKATREVAQALFRASAKIKAAVEGIVGWLRSLAGNDYVISKIEDDGAWSFDWRVAREHVRYVELDSLDERHKGRLFDMIVEGIAQLHAGNLIMGRFTLNNVLLHDTGITLCDLRKMRVSRKRSYVVEEFKNVMQYLFGHGLAEKGDIYGAVATYATLNEEGCREWYREKTGKMPSEHFEVASMIEKEISE